MTITFLGTGTSHGVPMIASNHPVCLSTDKKDKRLRASILVSVGNLNFVVDCGPDFRAQMLNNNVQSINGIFFTHEHADHVAGLDDIRAFSFKMGKVPLYATRKVFAILQHRFAYIFTKENRYPGAPNVSINYVDNQTFEFENLKITPIKVLHGDLPILAYRFNDVAYLTDVKSVSETEKEKLKEIKVLIVTALRVEPHPTHFNLQEALDFIKEIKPHRAYLTHISHKLGFHKEIEKKLPKNVFLAYDGLKIEEE